MWRRLSTLRLGGGSTDWASPRIPRAGDSTQLSRQRANRPSFSVRIVHLSAQRSPVATGDYDMSHRAVACIPYGAKPFLPPVPLMTQQRNRGRADAQPEPLSPELALVDPDLASRARARLAAIAVSESTVTAARRDGDNAAAHGRPTASAATLPQTQPSVRERLL